MRLRQLCAFVGLTFAAISFAQTTATTTPDAAPAVASAPAVEVDLSSAKPGDPKAGATKASACGACHGADGNSTDSLYPKIAGQHELFIATQLKKYKSGERVNAVMLGFAQALSAQDMRDIGAYFATTVVTPGIASDQAVVQGEPQTFAQLGESLYRGGDRGANLVACMACHGPTGRGVPGPSYPSIGGQHAAYTAARLKSLRDEMQCADATLVGDTHANAMACVADRLSDRHIQALSTYIEGLHSR